MLKKSTQKGGGQRVKKVLLPLPEDLHHQMHLHAVEQKMTMREFMIAAIRQALEKGGGRDKK
jgi:hypothetical protein